MTLKNLTRNRQAMLEQTYSPSEFIADDFKTSQVEYERVGKWHRYFPDIYIPAENRIIEVKSWYWLNKQIEKNRAIMTAAIVKGFTFEFWMFSGNQLTVINTHNSLLELHNERQSSCTSAWPRPHQGHADG